MRSSPVPERRRSADRDPSMPSTAADAAPVGDHLVQAARQVVGAVRTAHDDLEQAHCPVVLHRPVAAGAATGDPLGPKERLSARRGCADPDADLAAIDDLISGMTSPRLRAVAFHVLWTWCAIAVPAAAETSADGFTEPFRLVRVAAPEAGTVAELLVQEGARLKEGESIAKLDSAVHEALLAVAKADLEARGRVQAAQAELRLREDRLAALERLAAGGHARAQELQRAAADREIAAAQLRSTEETMVLKELEYERIRAQLDRRTIRSPLDGVVTEILKQRGEYVSPSDPQLMTIVQLDPLAATFAVPKQRTDSLSVGERVRVQLTDSGTLRDAEVVFISPVIDAESGTVRVRVVIPNADNAHRGGEPCQLLLQ